jgi:hypothetical protein
MRYKNGRCVVSKNERFYGRFSGRRFVYRILEAKMKILKTFLFFVLIVGIIHANLYSRISSRVSGIVKDYATGQVLMDVDVYLVIYDQKFPEPLETALTKTNNAGYFELNDIYKGKYFVKCEKPGYMTVNPIYLAQEQNPEGYLPIFFIDEGQIKYFEIKMKRGCSLKVTVQKKDVNGILGISEAQCWVSKNSKSKDPETGEPFTISVASPFADVNGVAIFDGLEPGEEYFVIIREHGLPLRKKNAIIKTDETIELNFLYDLTDKTGILGKIINKGKSPISTYISLALFQDGLYQHVTRLNIKGNTEFFIPNLSAGNYLLYVISRYEENNEM